MKINVFLALLLCISATVSSNAQGVEEQKAPPIQRFIERESRYIQDGLSVIKISSQMFEMMRQSPSVNNSEMKEFLKNMNELYIVSYEKNIKNKKNTEIVSRLNNNFRSFRQGYDELMTLSENSNSRIQIWTKSENNKVVDFLLMANDSTKFTVINILGNIDLKTLSNLRSMLKINELKHLDKIDPSRAN